jgi:hypothetical protein
MILINYNLDSTGFNFDRETSINKTNTIRRFLISDVLQFTDYNLTYPIIDIVYPVYRIIKDTYE